MVIFNSYVKIPEGIYDGNYNILDGNYMDQNPQYFFYISRQGLIHNSI